MSLRAAWAERAERALLLWPPAITMLVVALGLRIGASQEARAARVHGAPPAGPRHGLAWTVTVVREGHGVKEPVPGEPVHVSAAQKDGQTAEWDGSTNVDGVAEAWLALEGVEPGERVNVRVTSTRTGAILAQGMATVPLPYASLEASVDRAPEFLAASRRTGPIALDALVVGRSLAAEFPSHLLVRAADAATGAPLGDVRIRVEAEPGLDASPTSIRTCNNGWAEVTLMARAHVVGATLRAEEVQPSGTRTGEWYGAIPVAGGALFVSIPEPLHVHPELQLTVRSPSPRPVAYVEVDDAQGRARAFALDLQLDGSGMRSAPLPLPLLQDAPEKGFLVTSGDLHGAETLSGAALALPFWAPRPPRSKAAQTPAGPIGCEPLAILARMAARGFPRPLLLDGLGAVHATAARARGRGLHLALGTVLLAALVEALLLLRHAKRGRAALSGLPPHMIEGRGGTVAMGLGIGLLGFALLAALLLRSSS